MFLVSIAWYGELCNQKPRRFRSGSMAQKSREPRESPQRGRPVRHQHSPVGWMELGCTVKALNASHFAIDGNQMREPIYHLISTVKAPNTRYKW